MVLHPRLIRPSNTNNMGLELVVLSNYVGLIGSSIKLRRIFQMADVVDI